MQGGDANVGGVPDRSPGRSALDAATPRLHPAARETLLAALEEGWADPRRLYAEARVARGLLDEAREIVAAGLGLRPPELSFVPGGWSLPTALAGLLHARRRVGGTVLASAVEQEPVLARGATVVPVDSLGRVEPGPWSAAMGSQGVAAAVLQSANGEVGTTQPLARARAEASAHGIPLLVDASASLGRLPAPADFDVLVGEAGSFAGPAAVGLLAVREATRWALPGPRREAEHGRAEAGPWVPLALATAEAWRQVAATRESDDAVARDLTGRIRATAEGIEDVEVAGDPVERLPHVLTFSALYLDGESVVHELDRRGFGVASGSACTASVLAPSHVLAAMGALTHGNVRIVLPLPSVTPGLEAQVERFRAELPDVVSALRASHGVLGL